METKETKFDIYQHVTDQIVSMLATANSTGDLWQRLGGNDAPTNGATGYRYKGINTLYLWAMGYELGYQSSKWASYKDWQSKGRQVKAGEKSKARVIYWGKADKKAIFAIAGKAQQACDYLLNNSMAHKAVNEDRELLAA